MGKMTFVFEYEDGKEPPVIIGRFVPIGNNTCGRMPFNVLTRVASDYMPPAWEGIGEGGKRYHVIEKAWRFEPVEWNGEGLPPVGIACEMSYAGDEWHSCVIIAKGEEQIIYQTQGCREFSGHRNNYRFRPIRAEADKNRDEAIESIQSLIEYRNGCHAKALAKWLFEEIAAGKVPGIRID